MQAVKGTVPLAEMFGYATNLRSMTQGRGTFTMEFDHYDAVAAERARTILGLALERGRFETTLSQRHCEICQKSGFSYTMQVAADWMAVCRIAAP